MKYINEWSVEVNPIEIKMSGVWRFLNVFRGLGPLCGVAVGPLHPGGVTRSVPRDDADGRLHWGSNGYFVLLTVTGFSYY